MELTSWTKIENRGRRWHVSVRSVLGFKIGVTLVPSFLLLCLIVALPTSAQSLVQGNPEQSGTSHKSAPRFQVYTRTDGLSQSGPRDLMQDSRGFIWMTTADGLNRFDGYEFKVYTHDPRNDRTLSDNVLGFVHEDSRGYIWTEGADFTLNELDPISGNVTRHFMGSEFLSDPSESRVVRFLNDSNGNLWIGTGNGVVKYDVRTGTFTRFLGVTDASNPRRRITFFMVESPQGTLWANASIPGSNRKWVDRELYRIDLDTDEFVLINSKDEGALLPDGINLWSTDENQISWYKHSDGTFWVSVGDIEQEVDTRVFQYDSETSRFIEYSNARVESTNGARFHGLDFFESKDHELWILMANVGPVKINRASKTLIPYPIALQKDEHVQFYYNSVVDKTGLVLLDMVVASQGLYSKPETQIVRFNPETGKAEILGANSNDRATPRGLYNPKQHVDSEGHIWREIEGGGGFDRYDPESMEFVHFKSVSEGGSVFQKSPITSTLVDAEGNSWFTQPGNGLIRIAVQEQFFSSIANDGREPYKLETGTIRGLHEDRSGTFWIAAQDGIYRFDAGEKEFVEYSHVPVYENWISDPIRVFDLDDYDDNTLLLATGDGAYLFDKTSETFKHVQVMEQNPTRYPRTFLNSLARDGDGSWWFSSNEGLIHVSPDLGTVLLSPTDSLHSVSPLSQNLIKIYLDSQGTIWGLAQRNGIFSYDPVSGVVSQYKHDPDRPDSLPSGNNYDILEDPTNPDLFWIASVGSGLVRLDRARSSFTYFDVSNSGIPDNLVNTLLFDDAGKLWLSTNNGMARFGPKSGEFSTFGVEDGLQAEEFNRMSATKLSSGHLVFGGVNGITLFDPSEVRQNITPPTISITGFAIYNPARDSLRSYDGVDSNRKELTRLRYSENDITFSFAALSYINPVGNQYSYRLEGYEPTFSTPSSSRTVRYTNLPPGEYVFRIEASNSDGAWTENGYSFAFDIFPPWWRTIWAYFFYAGLTGIAIFQIDRFQRRRLVKKEAEKARIARAELEAETASARAAALQSENDFKELKLNKAKELEHAFSALQSAHEDLKTTQDRLVHSEKMASLGSLTAGIAHEIKNPLNFVNNFAEVGAEMADELREAAVAGRTEEVLAIITELQENATQITKHGRRADEIVKAMMQHARGGASEMESVDLNSFLEEYANLAWHGMRANDGDFQAELMRDYSDEVGLIKAMPQELGRVILNLLNNAFDAVRGVEAARVTIATRRADTSVAISVSDNGPGIPAEIRDKIFEPFFTTKATGEGTGLGLSLSYDIVTKGHGGTMTAESCRPNGATFVITIPA